MSKAFGEQNPTQGENSVSWQTWSDGDGGSPLVTGDADWGKLHLSNNEGRSAVYDLGSSKARTFTIDQNRYGTGDTVTVQIRYSDTSFDQDDIAPSWIIYSSPAKYTCRYVQVRATDNPADLILSVSDNDRYLITSDGNPIYICGDSAWSLGVQITDAEVDTYLANRSKKGFNAIIMNLIEKAACTNAPNDIYDNAPFTGEALTTPNETYFARIDAIISKAADYGIFVFLDPLYGGYDDTDGWRTDVAAASNADMTWWGDYVGNRYKDYPNIVWIIWADSDPTTWIAKMLYMISGLQAQDSNHLMTAHHNRGSLGTDYWVDDSWITLNSSYSTYLNLPAKIDDGYAYSPTKPLFQIEAYYEGGGQGMNSQGLRAQMYWSLLEGACGTFFGNTPLWEFAFYGGDWVAAMDLQGSNDASRFAAFVRSKEWYNLVPDSTNTVLTVGYGTKGTADYAPCAITPDDTLAIIYMPSNRTMTVDMSEFSGTVTCRWFDPTNGSYTADAASPHTNTGTHDFSRAGTNSSGDADWILVLEA